MSNLSDSLYRTILDNARTNGRTKEHATNEAVERVLSKLKDELTHGPHRFPSSFLERADAHDVAQRLKVLGFIAGVGGEGPGEFYVILTVPAPSSSYAVHE